MKSNDMFTGLNRVETAIARMQNFEPPDGYYLAFSGGKDSVALLALAKQSGVQFDAHYNLTTIDPPEVVQFIKTFHEVTIERPPETFCQLIQRRGLPRRQGRWCCEELKERGGSGRTVLTGVRWAESKGKNKRAHRRLAENCYKDTTKWMIHPIIDWQDWEVWEYIEENNLSTCELYKQGFDRIGCILCPMVRDVEKQIHRWPKITDAIKRAAYKYWERKTPGTIKFPTPESFWLWWLDRDANNRAEPLQQMAFDSMGVDED